MFGTFEISARMETALRYGGGRGGKLKSELKPTTNPVRRRHNWRNTIRLCGLWNRFRPCSGLRPILPTIPGRLLWSTRWTRMAVPVHRVRGPNRRRVRGGPRRRSTDRRWIGTANLRRIREKLFQQYLCKQLEKERERERRPLTRYVNVLVPDRNRVHAQLLGHEVDRVETVFDFVDLGVLGDSDRRGHRRRQIVRQYTCAPDRTRNATLDNFYNVYGLLNTIWWAGQWLH